METGLGYNDISTSLNPEEDPFLEISAAAAIKAYITLPMILAQLTMNRTTGAFIHDVKGLHVDLLKRHVVI